MDVYLLSRAQNASGQNNIIGLKMMILLNTAMGNATKLLKLC